MTNKSATLTTAKPRDDKQIVQRFSEVISRVNCEKPKAADMTELKQMLSDHDDLKLWQGVVSIARLSLSLIHI